MDEDEVKRFQKFYEQIKRQEGREEQSAAKKIKKDSTSSPSPNGRKIHALIKQTPARKDFPKSAPSPSPNGEKMHALIKQTPVGKNLTESPSSPSPNGEKVKVVRKNVTKPTSSPSPSPNGENAQALIKPQTLQANSQQKGKNVVSAEEANRKGPFVKKWYNLELENQDKETWDMINGCFRGIQSSNTKMANFWLSQLERSHTSLKHKLGEAHQLVSRLVSFSSTSRSDMLNAKERELFSGTETSSKEQRKLKSIFSRLQTADLVNLRIEDFLKLVKTLEIQADGVKELESKAEVQEMTNLYRQHLIDDNRLLAFFQKLEEGRK
ncbi:hypothetical protein M6B38_116590 [Iris pallida]|uniref:Uncharacterized protein n=1 Tax=Iris pallida TaxID=29817 RepID=A0AAX6I3N4_IRIPA|nr:hypothetical protein M6B38_116590 [Iris pallida]